jgi:hypothetical protein
MASGARHSGLQLCGMELNYAMAYSPLVLAGMVGSTIVFITLLGLDHRAVVEARTHERDPLRSRPAGRTIGRLHVGNGSLIELGLTGSGTDFSISKMLSEVLTRAPGVVVPTTLAWLAFLLGEPGFAASVAAIGVGWRVLYDYFFGLAELPREVRVKVIAMRLAFMTSIGVFLGSMAFLALLLVVGLLIVAGAAASGGTRKKPKKW